MPKRQISVFIASPSDLASERKAFKETVEELNKGFGDGAGVEFRPYGWEDENAETGRRVQGVINKRIAEADLFVLVLHRRWGQEAPDSRYSSYTEEEFRIAIERWKTTQSPEVLVFFKSVDAPSIADPGEQLKKVLAFKKELEQGRDVLSRPFQDERDFAREIDKHLRSFARGEFERLDEQATAIAIPAAIIDDLASATREGEALVRGAEERQRLVKSAGKSAGAELESAMADLTLVKARQKNFALARAAVDAAGNHRLEDAKILFAQARKDRQSSRFSQRPRSFISKSTTPKMRAPSRNGSPPSPATVPRPRGIT